MELERMKKRSQERAKKLKIGKADREAEDEGEK